MARLVLNDSEIENLLYGQAGPVYRHVEAFGTAVERIAKDTAPIDTGALRSSIDKDLPHQGAGSLTMKVGAPVLANHQGQRVDYAFIVHEGHGVLTPKTHPVMTFFWKRKGKFYSLKEVQPTAEQPYLWKAMIAANQNLPAGDRFHLTRAVSQLISSRP